MKPTITVDIPVYGLMAMIGLLLSIDVCLFRLKKYNYNHRILIVVIPFILIGMAIGAKVLFFITQLPHVFEDFSIVHLIQTFLNSGFVFYGGLIGAIAFTEIVARLLAIDGKKLRSFLAPSFALFHAFGRIGCFFGGCCYGIPWKYGIAMADEPDINRFPVQLVESGIELLVFIILLIIERRAFLKCNLMNIYLFCYTIARFFLEFLRDDEIRGIWWFGLSTSQYISLIIFSVCIVDIIRQRRNI